MGTYYIAVNYDKREYINPGNMGDGRKLPEFLRGHFPSALVLALDGRWSGDRVRLIDDFNNPEEYDEVISNFEDMSKYFAGALSEYRDTVRERLKAFRSLLEETVAWLDEDWSPIGHETVKAEHRRFAEKIRDALGR